MNNNLFDLFIIQNYIWNFKKESVHAGIWQVPSCLVPVLSPVGQDLDLVPRGHEGVEANDEVGVTLEQVGDPVYNAWRVDSVENRDKIKILFTMGLKFGFFPYTIYEIWNAKNEQNWSDVYAQTFVTLRHHCNLLALTDQQPSVP